MIASTKVPTLKGSALFLALSFALVACGGDAESAADLDSAPLESELAVEGLDPDAAPPADVTEPQAPPVQTPTRPPASGTQRQPAPPVQAAPDPVAPPPAEEPLPEIEEVLEEPETPMNALPVGTLISARLDEAISTRTHEEGDAFRARVTDDLRGGDGAVLVPAGTEVVGRVATARVSSDSREESVLVLAFDALVLDGRTLALRATVLDAHIAGDAADSGARSAATVATGAAAGAILGQVLGRDTRSTVAGAAVGAVAGAGIAMTTRDGHAVVPEGSTLRLQLDEPVVIAGVR